MSDTIEIKLANIPCERGPVPAKALLDVKKLTALVETHINQTMHKNSYIGTIDIKEAHVEVMESENNLYILLRIPTECFVQKIGNTELPIDAYIAEDKTGLMVMISVTPYTSGQHLLHDDLRIQVIDCWIDKYIHKEYKPFYKNDTFLNAVQRDRNREARVVVVDSTALANGYYIALCEIDINERKYTGTLRCGNVQDLVVLGQLEGAYTLDEQYEHLCKVLVIQ
jgi:hypothetical protein